MREGKVRRDVNDIETVGRPDFSIEAIVL